MGILIKDMQMPKIRGEYVFLLYVDSDGTATVEGAHSILKGEPFEAVPVPPHGRLGDLDELYAHLNEWYLTNNPVFTKEEALYIRAMLLGIVEAPTVIEASGKDVNATTKEET